ncbi:MAG: radical SAM protein [Oscillospiraceae bacterium]|nr:radical SAM protein [Oscillospiraceae bacterium]
MEYRCSDCPRRCGALRTDLSGSGFCRAPARPHIIRAAAHFGEEPCISGSRGAGTIFFTGCSLRCVFCQNREISRTVSGRTFSSDALRDLMLRLQDTGVHNIELVTPTHYTRVIAEALSKADLAIPVVWNSSGYELPETLRLLEGLVQVYMPDLKYLHAGTSGRYSAAPDYPDAVIPAIDEMFRQRGSYRMDDHGILQSGVLIRHLILPGNIEESRDVIDLVADRYPRGSILFSLMSQYTPMVSAEAFPELSRTVSPEENEDLLHYLRLRGLDDGYWQEPSSAGEESIPLFDGTGLDFSNKPRNNNSGICHENGISNHIQNHHQEVES